MFCGRCYAITVPVLFIYTLLSFFFPLSCLDCTWEHMSALQWNSMHLGLDALLVVGDVYCSIQFSVRWKDSSLTTSYSAMSVVEETWLVWTRPPYITQARDAHHGNSKACGINKSYGSSLWIWSQDYKGGLLLLIYSPFKMNFQAEWMEVLGGGVIEHYLVNSIVLFFLRFPAS